MAHLTTMTDAPLFGHAVLPLVLAMTIVGVAASTAQTARTTLPPEGAAALTAFLRVSVDRGDVPGAVVLVVSPEGVLYHEAFGRQDAARGVAMRTDTIFRIASMTKPLTSLVALMLIEEGRLGLDDEVGRYLPAWKAPAVITSVDAAGRATTRPATTPITIRHLLTHTSGIGYAWSHPSLAAIQQAAGTADLDLPLVNEPGERWMYGASTRVLGHVIETIAGTPIDAVLAERLTGPLGMVDTGFAVTAAQQARLVTIHQRLDGRLTEQPNGAVFPPSVRGDGGLVSTAADYGRFLRMLLNAGMHDGRRIAPASAIGAMTTNHLGARTVERQVAADRMRSKPYPLGAGADTWGLGFQLAARSPDPLARSEGSYSWAGINNTHFWVDPVRRVAVVVLAQVLPFYDDGAMAVLSGTERIVNSHLR